MMRQRMAGLTVVVPCYNEADRLDAAPLLAFLDGHPDASFLLVNDGSTDATAAVLDRLAAQRPGRIRALQLAPNRGKAEAVREGLRDALAAGGRHRRLPGRRSVDAARRRSRPARGARPPGRAGRDRRARRHARLRHRPQRRPPLPRPCVRDRGVADPAARVYDTQCGAKLFRAGPALSEALSTPFLSRWAFDVEFLGRLLIGSPGVPPLPLSAIVEVPLPVWHDVKGSKLGLGGMARTLRDLALVASDLAGPAARRAKSRKSCVTIRFLRAESVCAESGAARIDSPAPP